MTDLPTREEAQAMLNGTLDELQGAKALAIILRAYVTGNLIPYPKPCEHGQWVSHIVALNWTGTRTRKCTGAGLEYNRFGNAVGEETP